MVGIIPARAGFTPPPLARRRRSRDHPRSRGVYFHDSAGGSVSPGSSPLARGLPLDVAQHPDLPGIIPARAGFTQPPPPGSRPPADHPRSRGVYAGSRSAHWRAAGSSPLARGLPAPGVRAGAAPGIIPARAGFTTGSAPSWATRPDHPRSRGVYACHTSFAGLAAGSSPLARGLPGRGGPLHDGVGIIPARAGFTTTPSAPRPGARDHPRSRGVYCRCGRTRRCADGSSPLARGLLGPGRCAGRRGWIIPARAGFTRGAARAHHRAADHPRSRGVYWPVPVPCGTGAGSSPLARGLPTWYVDRLHTGGIIPARAGFTGPSCG